MEEEDIDGKRERGTRHDEKKIEENFTCFIDKERSTGNGRGVTVTMIVLCRIPLRSRGRDPMNPMGSGPIFYLRLMKPSYYSHMRVFCSFPFSSSIPP